MSIESPDQNLSPVSREKGCAADRRKTSTQFSSSTVMILRIDCLLLGKPNPLLIRIQCSRYSTSSKRWVARQRGDAFTREAKVQQYKSRAAFKLLEVPPLPLSYSPTLTPSS